MNETTQTDPFRLDGQVVLVTGASSGLGVHFARRLAQAGASVGLAARRLDRLEELAREIEAGGGKAVAVALDVNETSAIPGAIAAVEDALGPIDALVNNSGVSATARILDTTPEDFDHVMATNAKGAYFTAQAVARRMIEAGRDGRIINIASAAGLKPVPQLSVYAMSKAAVVHMTRSMAQEWLRRGINVNAICPGYIETELNAKHFTSEGGEKLMAALPRKRLGVPSDLDGLILLLASPSSRFITGSIFTADDGLCLS